MSGTRIYPSDKIYPSISLVEIAKIAGEIANKERAWFAICGVAPMSPIKIIERDISKTLALIKYEIFEIRKNHCQ